MSPLPPMVMAICAGVACWTTPFSVNIQWGVLTASPPAKQETQPQKKPPPAHRDLPLPPGMEIRKDIQEIGCFF